MNLLFNLWSMSPELIVCTQDTGASRVACDSGITLRCKCVLVLLLDARVYDL